MAKKSKAPKVDEFYFEQDCLNSGKLCYRCMELVISGDPANDELSASDLAFIEEIVATLNAYYPR